MKTLWDVIWYNGGKGPEDGNNYWRRITPWHYVWVGLMLTLMSVGIGMVALFVGAIYPGSQGHSLFLSYLKEPVILFLNILPALLLTAFFYFATGRAWSAFLGSALLMFGFTIVGFYKMAIRSETLVASDISLVDEALGVISNYTIEITGRPLLTIGSFLLGLLFAIFVLRGHLKNVWVRVTGSLLTAAAIAVVVPAVYLSDTMAAKVTNDSANINIWVDQQVFASKGFVYSFLHSISDAFPKAPEGYDGNEAADVLARYSAGTIDDSKKVNVIAVMLEAYCDLSEYPQVGVLDQVYAPFHKLQEESLHGHIVANVFGGGTVDTERNFLTGYPDSEEYRGLTDSYIWFLRENGYRAEGYHSGDAWFYNRKNVEMNLGMERFLFMTDYGSQDRSDSFFFARLHELIENRDKSAPYFNFSVTYQNHGSYIGTYTGETAYLQREGKDDATFFTVNNYLTGIADTSQRMLDFVDSLRDSAEPFVVVFFGDHKPYLGYSYGTMGINMDVGTEEGFYNCYTTPYIIWANDAAKKATGGSFTGDGGDISACFLMDKVFEECGWGRSAYGQLVHETAKTVSVIDTGTEFSVVNGVLNHTLTGEGNEAVETLRRTAYYCKHHFPYTDLVS